MKPKIKVSELEKKLIPNSYELFYEEETLKAIILDEELVAFKEYAIFEI